MSSSSQVIIEEVLKWSIPIALTGLAAWAAVKRKALKDWSRSRKAHKKGLHAMVETWPTMTAASTRITQEFAAINGMLTDIDEASTTRSTALNNRLDKQDLALNDLLAMGQGQFELSEIPTFLADGRGYNLMVNSSYARLLGVGRDELLGFGYKRFMSPDGLAIFWNVFQSATQDHIEIDLPIWFNTPKRIHICIRMIPHPRQIGPATHWVGTLSLCDETSHV